MPTQVQVQRKREAIKAYEVRPLTDVRISRLQSDLQLTEFAGRCDVHYQAPKGPQQS
jgi:hypothetical protein